MADDLGPDRRDMGRAQLRTGFERGHEARRIDPGAQHEGLDIEDPDTGRLRRSLDRADDLGSADDLAGQRLVHRRAQHEPRSPEAAFTRSLDQGHGIAAADRQIGDGEVVQVQRACHGGCPVAEEWR
ncbi:hypothetical protein AB6806_25945 [Bosea sp. RCC_152_1]|uniref:hypothetical protein n=1 Tax=Bosea sp. RCC_152_1 TaxID=3239228 RepID=UPI00352581E1